MHLGRCMGVRQPASTCTDWHCLTTKGASRASSASQTSCGTGALSCCIRVTDCIHSFLNEHVDKLGSLADQTAEQLGWANKPLIGVTPERPAIDAMELMVQKGISAVAVLGHNDKLIGNFSVSELRCVA